MRLNARTEYSCTVYVYNCAIVKGRTFRRGNKLGGSERKFGVSQKTSTSKHLELAVFKLFIFTVVISGKSCFEQNNAWSRFALILFKLHKISLPPDVIL